MCYVFINYSVKHRKVDVVMRTATSQIYYDIIEEHGIATLKEALINIEKRLFENISHDEKK